MTTTDKVINRRTATGWIEVTNDSLTHCDKCLESLWVSPGGDLYCDKEGCGI